jgi:hypothetical protein
MDGILLPALGVFASICLYVFSLLIPRFRRYALSALTAPFLASVTLLLGGFILADMNPAREYGAAYILNGKEHDPTRMDFFLMFLSAVATFVISGCGAFFIQKYAVSVIGRRLQSRRGRSLQ